MSRTQGTRTATTDLRISAVALVNGGMSPARVAAGFGVRPDTVRRWVILYRKRGGEGLRNHPAAGRSSRLPNRQLQSEIQEILGSIESSRWGYLRISQREVARKVGERTGRSYHVDHLTRRIRGTGGFSDRFLPAFARTKDPRNSIALSRETMVSIREMQAFQKAARADDIPTARRMLAEEPNLAFAAPKGGISPLLLAGYVRSDELVKDLRGRGVVPDVFEASVLGDTQRLERILSADPKAVQGFSPDGWTPLHLAVGYSRIDAAKLLLKHRAPLDAVSKNGIRNQPLQAAVAGGNPALVGLILEAGGEPDHRSHGGFTAAHIAAEGGDVKILELLRTSGADLSKPADGGKTPRDIAIENGQKAAANWLEKHTTGPSIRKRRKR